MIYIDYHEELEMLITFSFYKETKHVIKKIPIRTVEKRNENISSILEYKHSKIHNRYITLMILNNFLYKITGTYT